MTLDEQHAKSLHFAEQLQMVLRLPSGKIAVYNYRRGLMAVVDSLDEVKLEPAEVVDRPYRPKFIDLAAFLE